jgi:LAS superfamily LD-carboxypeptidase LdcB
VSPPSGSVTWSDVTKVGGIWVNRSIAGNVRALLDSASAAGVNLSGGGFRDPEQQVALRRAHCGTTQYDIYEKPASQCSPPTAVPGRSMHERGLAIDFKYNGSLITSRSSAGYQWLAANAARFGLYNLPSEPWHWSTNGN